LSRFLFIEILNPALLAGNCGAGVFLLTSPVQGMVYMCRDSAGIAHYTNKEYDVLTCYKAKAKSLLS
jgi:hypothetical protein